MARIRRGESHTCVILPAACRGGPAWPPYRLCTCNGSSPVSSTKRAAAPPKTVAERKRGQIQRSNCLWLGPYGILPIYECRLSCLLYRHGHCQQGTEPHVQDRSPRTSRTLALTSFASPQLVSALLLSGRGFYVKCRLKICALFRFGLMSANSSSTLTPL